MASEWLLGSRQRWERLLALTLCWWCLTCKSNTLHSLQFTPPLHAAAWKDLVVVVVDKVVYGGRVDVDDRYHLSGERYK